MNRLAWVGVQFTKDPYHEATTLLFSFRAAAAEPPLRSRFIFRAVEHVHLTV
jgi:hypothetical protein